MPAPGQTAPTPTTANAKVAELQRVLATYARVTGFAAANPGPADGIVGTRTIMAVVAVAPNIPGLPSEIRALIPLATVILATTEGQAKAKDIITRNASNITKAMLAVAALQIANGQSPTGPKPGAIVPFPIGPTANGGGQITIWFYDPRRQVYRRAVPRGLQGLGAAAYIEIAPSPTPPNSGTQVDKNTFLTQTGQWYATTWGIATIVGAGSIGLGGIGYLLTRAFRR